MSKKKGPSIPLYRNLAVSFAALTLLLVVVILYFSIARATIVVVPRAEQLPLEATLTVMRQGTETEGAAIALPGALLRETIEKTDTFPTSFSTEEDARARGAIRIVNESSQAQALVATTRLLSPEKILFRLESAVRVPAGGAVEAVAVADVPGAAGELAPTRFTIPGLSAAQQRVIYAVSEAPMAGGRQTVYALTEDDVENARKKLLEALEHEAREKLTGGRSDLAVILSVEEQTRELSESLGSRAQTFTMKLRAIARGVAVAPTVLNGWIVERLSTSLADDQRLMPITHQDVTMTIAAMEDDASRAHLLLTGKGAVTLRTTSSILDRTRFVGRTPREVERILEDHSGIVDATIAMTPRMLKRLPRVPDHIRIVVEEPR